MKPRNRYPGSSFAVVLMTLFCLSIFVESITAQDVKDDSKAADSSQVTESTETVAPGNSNTETQGTDASNASTSIESSNPSSESVPSWVSRGDYQVDTSDYHLISVQSNEGIRDCERLLNEALIDAVEEYLQSSLHRRAPEYLAVDPSYIRNRLLVDEHKLVREMETGGHRIYAQLRFDDDFRREFSIQWQKAQQQQRLANLAVLGSATFGFLFVVFGYFRLNHATRGFYAGRLQFLTGLAILALIVGGVFALRAFPWI